MEWAQAPSILGTRTQAIQSRKGAWRLQAQPCICVVGGHSGPGAKGHVQVCRGHGRDRPRIKNFSVLCKMASPRTLGRPPPPRVIISGARYLSGPGLVVFLLWDCGQRLSSLGLCFSICLSWQRENQEDIFEREDWRGLKKWSQGP